jgi:HK97 family phage portal protein
LAINITGTEVNADILQAMVQGVPVNKHTALEIPMISRCISMIADAVAALPIKLYRKVGDGVEEVKDDRRVVILNGDTGDTLNADYMRQVMVRDYLLYGNAYAYIETSGGKADKLFYVDAELVGRELTAMDPIHKQYRYIINGQQYMPYKLLKILRNSDGYGCGTGIIEENPELIAAAYGLLQYHKKMILTGGAKRGILRTQKLNKDVLADVKAKWAALWAGKSDQDTMMVLNSSDMDFKELSTSSVDMQVNQTQETLDKEIMKLFGTADGLLSEDTVKNAVMPVIDAIEAALDSDLLLEREKGEYYFAFDTRELTRGDITQRFNAYATALSQNFMQLDEVRAMEDLPPLGINFVKLGLNDVLLDPKTGQIYTPNTNQYAVMGESAGMDLTNEENDENTRESTGQLQDDQKDAQ